MSSSSPTMLRPVWTDHCVAALERAGFVATRLPGDRIVMAKGDRQLVVVHNRMMQPSEIELVLKAAGMTPDEFVEHLTHAMNKVSGVVSRDAIEEAASKARSSREG